MQSKEFYGLPSLRREGQNGYTYILKKMTRGSRLQMQNLTNVKRKSMLQKKDKITFPTYSFNFRIDKDLTLFSWLDMFSSSQTTDTNYEHKNGFSYEQILKNQYQLHHNYQNSKFQNQ